MSLIFAIDSDKRQSAQLALLLRSHVNADLVQSSSASEGLGLLQGRVPDLILTSSLMSPRDEAALANHLRELGMSAAHVQTLTVPVLATSSAAAPHKKPAGMLSAFRRERTVEATPNGCDPEAFAKEVRLYLERAVERREDPPPSSATAAIGFIENTPESLLWLRHGAAPVEPPAPAEPAFVEPAFVGPAFVEPAFAVPASVEPAFVVPTFVEPAFVEPAFVEPAFVEPAFVEPAFEDPAPFEMLVTEPIPAEPAAVTSVLFASEAVAPTAAAPTVEPYFLEQSLTDPKSLDDLFVHTSRGDWDVVEPLPTYVSALDVEPVYVASVCNEPVFAEPVFADLAPAEPVFEEPVFAEPVFAEPAFEEPVFAEPVVAEPVFADPIVAEPALAETVFAEYALAEPVVDTPILVESTGVTSPSLELTKGVSGRVELADDTPLFAEPSVEARPMHAEAADDGAIDQRLIERLRQFATIDTAPEPAVQAAPSLPDFDELLTQEPAWAEPTGTVEARIPVVDMVAFDDLDALADELAAAPAQVSGPGYALDPSLFLEEAEMSDLFVQDAVEPELGTLAMAGAATTHEAALKQDSAALFASDESFLGEPEVNAVSFDEIYIEPAPADDVHAAIYADALQTDALTDAGQVESDPAMDSEAALRFGGIDEGNNPDTCGIELEAAEPGELELEPVVVLAPVEPEDAPMALATLPDADTEDVPLDLAAETRDEAVADTTVQPRPSFYLLTDEQPTIELFRPLVAERLAPVAADVACSDAAETVRTAENEQRTNPPAAEIAPAAKAAPAPERFAWSWLSAPADGLESTVQAAVEPVAAADVVAAAPAEVQELAPPPAEAVPSTVDDAPPPVDIVSAPAEVVSAPVEVVSAPVQVASAPLELVSAPVEVTASPVDVIGATVEPAELATPAPAVFAAVTAELVTSDRVDVGAPDTVQLVTPPPAEETGPLAADVMTSPDAAVVVAPVVAPAIAAVVSPATAPVVVPVAAAAAEPVPVSAPVVVPIVAAAAPSFVVVNEVFNPTAAFSWNSVMCSVPDSPSFDGLPDGGALPPYGAAPRARAAAEPPPPSQAGGPALDPDLLAIFGAAAHRASLNALESLSDPDWAPRSGKRTAATSTSPARRWAPRTAPRPTQDEWGIFDPSQCGTNALFDDEWDEDVDEARPKPRPVPHF